jgi:hypothetical protein
VVFCSARLLLMKGAAGGGLTGAVTGNETTYKRSGVEVTSTSYKSVGEVC